MRPEKTAAKMRELIAIARGLEEEQRRVFHPEKDLLIAKIKRVEESAAAMLAQFNSMYKRGGDHGTY